MAIEITLDNTKYPIVGGICFTVDGYSASQDIRTPYLGKNRGFHEKQVVTLKALLQTNKEVEDLMYMWRTKMDEGQGIFMTRTEVFGKEDMYGFRQISPIVHTKPNGANIITFKAEVMFDAENALNTLPSVKDVTIHVRKNSTDNFITLHGVDKDGDRLTFEVQVGTGLGDLVGKGANLYYTPDHDMVGNDCFTFIAKDYFGASQVAIATIVVDEFTMPVTQVDYTITSFIDVGGNYYYDLGDGIWLRGTGGRLEPITDTIKIRSYDHKIDPSTGGGVKDVLIVKWGDRTDWSDVCVESSTVTGFSIAQDAGVCKGEIFDRMFKGSDVTVIPLFSTAKGVSFDAMFMESEITAFSDFDLSEGRVFSNMFKRSKLEAVGHIKTPKGEYFDGMFMDTRFSKCLNSIDTRNAISTMNMFRNAGFATPDVPTQGQILTGLDFKTTAVNCLVGMMKITKTGGTETCLLPKQGDKCKSEGTYKLTLGVTPAHGVTYQWTTNGTIKSGGTTDTVTVESPLSAGPTVNVWLECTVKEGGRTSSTGRHTFAHKRTTGYLVLTLPKSYKTINLAAFIKAHNPSNKKEVTVYNNIENIHTETGSLTGLTVTFINNGKLLGLPVAKRGHANTTTNVGFVATSDLKLINNGWIKGAGGWGGKGGKGKDTTYNESKYKRDSSWRARTDNKHIEIYDTDSFQGTPIIVKRSDYKTFLGPIVFGIYTYHRQEYISSASNGHRYFWSKRWTVKHKRVGGAGGYGGNGIGYNKARKSGTAGKGSTPTGGYSGGRGGYGGDWGNNGSTGAKGGGGVAGGGGYHGAKAIVGKTHLISGSKTGNVKGSIA